MNTTRDLKSVIASCKKNGYDTKAFLRVSKDTLPPVVNRKVIEKLPKNDK